MNSSFESKMDIIYSEGALNMDWKNVMALVRDKIEKDPELFLEEGGWDFLQEQSDEGASEAEDEIPEGDSVFTVSEDGLYEEESEYSESEDDDEEESEFEGMLLINQ